MPQVYQDGYPGAGLIDYAAICVGSPIPQQEVNKFNAPDRIFAEGHKLWSE
jgi:hypothetical protein